MPYVRRGMTLVEVSISLTLMVMLLGSVLGLLASTRSLHLSFEHRATRAQAMAAAVGRLSRELSFTRFSLITAGDYTEFVNGEKHVNGVSPWLGFPSGCGDDGSMVTDSAGAPVYQRYVIYIARDNKLLRQEFRDLDLNRRLSFDEVRTASQRVAGEVVLENVPGTDFDLKYLARGGYVEFSIGNGKSIAASGFLDSQYPSLSLRVYQ